MPSLIFDTKLYKNLQTTVNRRLKDSPYKISLGAIREYVANNTQSLSDKSFPEVVDLLVDLTKETETLEISGTLTTKEDVTQENSLIYMNHIYEEKEIEKSPENALAKPEQPKELSTEVAETTTVLGHVVEKVTDLNFGTKAVTEAVIEHELTNIVSSAQDLQEKLGALRNLETEIVSDVLGKHLQAKANTLESVKHKLSSSQVSAVERGGSYTANFTQTLEEIKAKFSQSV